MVEIALVNRPFPFEIEPLEARTLLAATAPTAAAAAAALGADTAADRVDYDAPIVIRHGGTYTGNWQSLDPDIPAVRIKTDERVTIKDSTVRGRGNLIESEFQGADITIVNTRGYGMNPDQRGRVAGRFVEAEFFDNILIKNNYLRGTSGIRLYDYRGNSDRGDTVRIVKNRAKNIDGRKSDGDGGYLAFNTRVNSKDGRREDGFERVQFVQLNDVRDVAGVEIAWNEIVNQPGKSRVEDNINIFDSSGTRKSPIRIYDNYVRGAFNIKPDRGDYTRGNWKYIWDYSGGGIMLGDGTDPAYVRAFRNQIVATTNYGIAIYAGHDHVFYDNRVIASGRLAGNRSIAAQNVGVYIWDGHEAGKELFYNNSAHDNLIGWMSDGQRNDFWVPDAKRFDDNTPWPGTITLASESAEWDLWHAKLSTAAVSAGPTRGSALADMSV